MSAVDIVRVLDSQIFRCITSALCWPIADAAAGARFDAITKTVTTGNLRQL